MSEVFLDTRTLLFVVSVMMLVLAATFFLLHRVHKKTTGPFEWSIAYVCFTFVAILLGLRGSIPEFISIVIGNGFNLAGFTFFYFGCCKFVNTRPRTYLVIIIVSVFWGPFFFIYQPLSYLGLRVFFVSMTLSSLSFMISHVLFTASYPKVVAHRIVGGFFSLYGGIHLITAVWFIVAPNIESDLLLSNAYDGLINSWYSWGTIASSAGFMLAFSVGLVVMITERLRDDFQKRVDELAIAQTITETALREQRSFYAMISHEFRTPLSVINAATEIISMNLSPTEDESQEEIDRIHRSSAKLTNIIDTLLTDDWLESSVVVRKHEPISLQGLLKATSREYNLYFHSENQADFMVGGDRSMLPVVFSNLMDNAVKYGRNPDAVRITCYLSENHETVVEVSDDGPGIDPTEKELIFEKFYRSERVYNKQGSGLGLYLVKRILDLHNARIENEKTDTHNIFRVIFPSVKKVSA